MAQRSRMAIERWSVAAVLAGISLVILSSCQQASSAGDSPTRSKDVECRNVETRLVGQRAAGDPAAYAREQGLDYRNGKVLVVIELKEAGQPLPGGYDFDEQARQANLLQGYLRVEQICALASESQVSHIRTPAVPMPSR